MHWAYEQVCKSVFEFILVHIECLSSYNIENKTKQIHKFHRKNIGPHSANVYLSVSKA